MTNRDKQNPRNPKFGDRFPPESIAIVGISRNDLSEAPGYTGLRLFQSLRSSGFSGRLYPVNPNAREIEGVKAYPSLTALPEHPDLVIITVPAPAVPQVIDDCVAAKAGNVHICSSGFGETGAAEGKMLESRILARAAGGGIKIIGPNCMGFHVPAAHMKMFPELPEAPGSIAFISQSGGHCHALLMNSPGLGIGFSKAISYGNGIMLGPIEFLEYLADDSATQIICMYLEGIQNGRELIKTVKRIVPRKPVILWKGGLTSSGARAAMSHTGSLAGDREVWDGFFRQTGAIEVDSLEEMAEVAMTFQNLQPITGARAAVLGMGGGNSVSNGDICAREGLTLPPYSDRTIKGLSQFVSLVNQGMANPMDVPAVINNPEYFSRTLKLFLDDPLIDMIILSIDGGYMAGQWTSPRLKENLTDFLRHNPMRKPIVAAVTEDWYLCEAESYIQEMRKAGITFYRSLTRACRALRRFAAYHRFIRKS